MIATPRTGRSIFGFCRYLSITITLFALSHPHMGAQAMTTQAPPSEAQPLRPESPAIDRPDAPDAAQYPTAQVVVEPSPAETVTFTSDRQSYRAGVYLLAGDVVLTYGSRNVHADSIQYNANTGELTATGHLRVTDDSNAEQISASHGSYNLRSATGRFYDVSGSVGLRPHRATAETPGKLTYTTPNPFLFSGREVVKSGPTNYDIYDGAVTSCLLPRPDWLLTSAHFSVAGERASAHDTTFRLLNLPIVFLPYVTHSLDEHARQSGFLIPTIGESSERGLVLGEQIYTTLGRSADLTVGAEYYSLRGFAQNATFRSRGRGLNFLDAHYSGLLDRRAGAGNQGGEDVLAAGRFDFSPNTRAAANVEYLSSYIYREAFTNNFNQAITSDIVSTVYAVHHAGGIELAALADRYQGIKLIAQGSTPQQQVRIFHAPELSATTTEHRLPTGLQVSLESSAAGLKRTQPNFVTGGIVERIDIHPHVAYDAHLGGWNLRPALAVRETLYNRSRQPNSPERTPVESLNGLIRSDVEFSFEARPPVITRTFTPGPAFRRLLGTELRHTIAPELKYRLTKGISNFDQVLRFDPVDVASDTDEIEYGVTQRLYRKTAHHANCEQMPDEPSLNPIPGEDLDSGQEALASPPVEIAASNHHPCAADEVLSWRLTQKYFFDPTFGHAVVKARRNIFTTTLDLSGVAFLTEPREISPLVSRLRLRTSAHTDLEWDFDLDTGASKFTSSNVYLDLHQRNTFAALSYARLDAPGRFYTQNIQNSTEGVSSAVSNFDQLRVLLGYGSPVKRGLSIAGNTGLDLKSFTGTGTSSASQQKSVFPALLQYLAVQTSYNWNCCGVAFEYREFELGAVHNVPGYRFSFSLANVGTAGNLRRAERLF